MSWTAFFDECQVLGTCRPLCPSAQRGNQLEEIEGLGDQKSLQVLDLSSNRIVSMSGLQSLQLLCSLNLEKNLVQIENFLTGMFYCCITSLQPSTTSKIRHYPVQKTVSDFSQCFLRQV